MPQDELVFKYDLEGKPVYELPEDAVSVKAFFEVLQAIQMS